MRARIAASAGVAALVVMVLAGCNFITPQQTLVPYDPSDGVSATIGDVDVLNAVILSDDGVSGNLVFTALNSTTTDVDLIVQYESEGEKVTLDLDVAANGSTEFGFGEGGQLFLAGIDTQPGGLLPVYFQYGAAQGRQLLVPVLDGALEQYAPLLPTPTPTSTVVPYAPTPTPTPAS